MSLEISYDDAISCSYYSIDLNDIAIGKIIFNLDVNLIVPTIC